MSSFASPNARLAYIQYDWAASSASKNARPNVHDETLHAQMTADLKKLSSFGVINMATWESSACGTSNLKADARRNSRQICASDCVITLLYRDDPPTKHWGSIACMAFACGKGIPSYVVCSKDNCIRKNHFMHHDLITIVENVDDLYALWTK